MNEIRLQLLYLRRVSSKESWNDLKMLKGEFNMGV